MSEETEEYTAEVEEEQEQAAEVEESVETGNEEGDVDHVAEEDTEDGEKQVPLKAQIAERKKRQEAEEKLRTVEARLQELENRQQPQAPAAKTVEEIFDADPESTLNLIDQEIAARESAFAATYNPEDEAAIKQLERTKINLLQRQFLQTRRQDTERQRVAPVEAALRQIIPDDAKKAELRAFAIENGLKEKDVDAMLNPAVVGDFAPRAAQMLANLHAKVTQPATRRVSKAPDPINTVGGKQGAATKDTSKMSDAEWLDHERQRLAKSGRLY